MKNKELRAWIFLAVLQLTWIVPCVYAYTHQEPAEEEWIEETEDVIRWRIDDAEVSIEELEVDVVKETGLPQERLQQKEERLR